MDLTRCLILLVLLVLVIFGLAMLIFYSGFKPKSSIKNDENELSHFTSESYYTSSYRDSEMRLRKDQSRERKDSGLSQTESRSGVSEPSREFTHQRSEHSKIPKDKKVDVDCDIPLILDKIQEGSLYWSYESEGETIYVTKNQNVSAGMAIFTHSREQGTFTLEELRFGGKVYSVPHHEKVLAVHTYGFESDPGFCYFILVVDQNSGSKVYKNTGEKFVVDLGTHDFRNSMERMAIRLGRDIYHKKLFNLTALANFDFGIDEINVTRDRISDKYIALVHTNLYGNILSDGYSVNGKEQYGLPAGRPYCSIVVYYPENIRYPLLVKLIEEEKTTYYRNDSFDTWKETEFLDLEKHLEQIEILMSLKSRLDYYVDLFTQKEEIPIDVSPVVDNNTYRFIMIDKLKLTQTTYMFVFEYPECIRNMVELPVLTPLKFIGVHEKPSVPGYWNHVKLNETSNEVVRQYTPIYIDTSRRRIHFLVRLYLPCDLFPDGGKFTRYLDKLLVNQTLRIQTSSTKYRFVDDNLFDGLDKTVHFDTLNLVAGGTGIAPFIRLLNYYQDLPFNINMIICSQTSEEVILKQLFDRFAKINYRLRLTYLILDEYMVPEGMVSEHPREVISSQFYNSDKALTLICGQLAFGDMIYEILKSLKFKNIYYL